MNKLKKKPYPVTIKHKIVKFWLFTWKLVNYKKHDRNQIVHILFLKRTPEFPVYLGIKGFAIITMAMLLTVFQNTEMGTEITRDGTMEACLHFPYQIIIVTIYPFSFMSLLPAHM